MSWCWDSGPWGAPPCAGSTARDARVFVVEPDAERVASALEIGLSFEETGLAEGLARCDLIFDACPAAGIIDAADVRPGMIAAVPGMPSAFTAAAQEVLGVTHMHEPLAVGVAVMAARALL